MGPIKFKLFKGLPRNKRFNYTPRYYKGKENTDESKYETKLPTKTALSLQQNRHRLSFFRQANYNKSDYTITFPTNLSVVL